MMKLKDKKFKSSKRTVDKIREHDKQLASVYCFLVDLNL